MNSTEQLQALLARVERAIGPDRELDAGIIAVLFDGTRTPLAVGSYGLLSKDNEWLAIPALSASTDAAIALVEKVLPGCQKSLIESHTIMATRGYRFSCDLYDTTGPDGQHYGRFQGVGWEAEGAGNSFPLAILAALLRALISQSAAQAA